jgi:hypothetical protein
MNNVDVPSGRRCERAAFKDCHACRYVNLGHRMRWSEVKKVRPESNTPHHLPRLNRSAKI